MFPPGLEPGTFRVLGERDNHYTTETPGRINHSSNCILNQFIILTVASSSQIYEFSAYFRSNFV